MRPPRWLNVEEVVEGGRLDFVVDGAMVPHVGHFEVMLVL